MQVVRLLGLLAIVGLIAGCNEARSVDPQVTQDIDVQVEPTQPGETDPVGGDQVTLNIATWDEINETIAAHQGKVVVVDLWSTSCVPCLRELPKLAELQKRHPETVACVSVSVDYIGAVGKPPESYRDKVLKSLEDAESTVQNFLSSTPDEEVYAEIKATSTPLAAIPAVFVYDRDGKLLKRFDNDKNDYGEEGFTYADHIEPLVEETLGREQ